MHLVMCIALYSSDIFTSVVPGSSEMSGIV